MNAQAILLKCVQDEDIIRHSERVVLLCRKMAEWFKQNGEEVNLKLLLDAAWLHDVAKEKCKKEKRKDDHNKPDEVMVVIKNCPLDSDIDIKKVTEVIWQHRGKFDAEKRKSVSAILRMSDKLDKLNKAMLKKTKGAEEKKEEIKKALKSCIDSLVEIALSRVLKPHKFDILCEFSVNYIMNFLMALADPSSVNEPHPVDANGC